MEAGRWSTWSAWVSRSFGACTYRVRVNSQAFRPLERRVTLNASSALLLDVTLVIALAEDVAVRGQLIEEGIPLDAVSEAGSRLGLTPRELPASIEFVAHDVILERGHRTVQDAVASAVDVTVGEHQADNASFTTRGW